MKNKIVVKEDSPKIKALSKAWKEWWDKEMQRIMEFKDLTEAFSDGFLAGWDACEKEEK